MSQLARRCATPSSGTCFHRLRPVRKHSQSRRRRPCRALNILDQTAKPVSFGIANAHRCIEDLLGDLSHAVQQAAATREHYAARKLTLPTGVFDFISDVHQHFLRTWLENVAKYLARKLSRRAPTD